MDGGNFERAIVAFTSALQEEPDEKTRQLLEDCVDKTKARRVGIVRRQRQW